MKVRDVVNICHECLWRIYSPNTKDRHGSKFDLVYESNRHYAPDMEDAILDLEVSEVECSVEYVYATGYVRLSIYTK